MVAGRDSPPTNAWSSFHWKTPSTDVRDYSAPVAVDKFKRLVEDLADEDLSEDMEICGGMTSSRRGPEARSREASFRKNRGKRSSLLIWMTATEHLHLMSADCLSLRARVDARTLHLQLTGNGGFFRG